MKTFILLVATLLVAAEAKRNMRSALGFEAMIKYTTGRNALDYNGYGCWCGLGPYFQNPTPVDKLDRCCRSHDNCYSDTGCGILQWEVVNPYNWHKDATTGEITCTDSQGSCDRANCECDKTAAYCFANSPYQEKYRDYPNTFYCW